MEIGKKFGPHPNLKKVYYTYLGLTAILPLLASFLPFCALRIVDPIKWSESWPYLLIPPLIVIGIIIFVAWWIGKYYKSITYLLTKDEIMVERGVWWKMKHVVPYGRVMSVDIIQGPISRHFGVGAVHVYTAGYTGVAGGTTGPGTRGPEASIWGVPNFVEIRDTIIEFVRGRPLFAATKTTDIGSEILNELRKIRKAVEK